MDYVSKLKVEDLKFWHTSDIKNVLQLDAEGKYHIWAPLLWALDFVERVIDQNPNVPVTIKELMILSPSLSILSDNLMPAKRYITSSHYPANHISIRESIVTNLATDDQADVELCYSFLLGTAILHEIGVLVDARSTHTSLPTYTFDRILWGGEVIHDPPYDVATGVFVLRITDEAKYSWGVIPESWILHLFSGESIPHNLHPPAPTRHIHFDDRKEAFPNPLVHINVAHGNKVKTHEGQHPSNVKMAEEGGETAPETTHTKTKGKED